MNQIIKHKRLVLLTISIIAISLIAVAIAISESNREPNYSPERTEETLPMDIASYHTDSLEELKNSICEEKDELIPRKCELINSGSDKYYITFEYDMMDDSVAVRRLYYRIERNNDGWSVTGLESEHRCREGRGNTNWHTGLCI